MHLLNTTTCLLDETEAAIDLGQSPASAVFLSFSDSDLALVSTLYREVAPLAGKLRVASLARLRHPYSVDLYLEKTACHARFVLVRLLGGVDYWRYGAEELAQAARRQGFELALIPGDGRADPQLAALSTLPADLLARLWEHFLAGGADNLRHVLDWIADRVSGGALPLDAPQPVPLAGRFEEACRPAPADAPTASLIFYRSHYAAADVAPVRALAEALAARGFGVSAHFVTSLKEPVSAAYIRAVLAQERTNVILNTTAFSSRLDGGDSPLDGAGVPILQAVLTTGSRAAWQENPRGLSATDLAMSIVLPEIDGRLTTTAIAFKNLAPYAPALEFTPVVQEPDPGQIAAVADLAAGWARLARRPVAERRLACILSNYPGKRGREGFAVGLDTPASLLAIADSLRGAGYAVGALPNATALMQTLTATGEIRFAADTYRRLFEALPPAFQADVVAVWGEPPDADIPLRACIADNFIIAVQPDRGARETRKRDYHDGAVPPCHPYIAFYLWLRHSVGIDALLHLGTHGTLEWLPGKAVALTEACAPQVLLGPTPLVYPFIVNNPGEAAQAKRRTTAVTLGHLTPPLTLAGSTPQLRDLEELLDEYAAAQSLDPKRARRLAELLLERAVSSGVAAECGIAPGTAPEAALAQLDNYLCDVKELRINDGLHIYGQPPELAQWRGGDVPISAAAEEDLSACGAAEMSALLLVLDGRFVPPGPAGAPSRGRWDVLPTGRNLFTIDPRQVPTRTAWEFGQLAADALVARYLQEYGDWPQRIVLDLWGSATMRTGGEELAQALALMGLRPERDEASARVTGFTILPHAVLDRPRIDVTLRISGLFRDVFPQQIALFDQAVQAVAALEEAAALNPLAAEKRADPGGRIDRIYGAAPGDYGAGSVALRAISDTEARAALGHAYLRATSHAYDGDGARRSDGFGARVQAADAYVHVQDMAGQDLLDTAALADHEGGFAAASAALGGKAALYHLDTNRPEAARVRTLQEEVARIVRGRVANPKWLAGQMRHGHRGGAEIAESVDNLMAFAVLAECVSSQQIDLVFEATLGDAAVREFVQAANPAAARALAEQFRGAQDRGFWTPRRNSILPLLADLAP